MQAQRFTQLTECRPPEPEIAAPAITVRGDSCHQANGLEHLEMMGKEIRAKSKRLGKFRGGAIRNGELVDNTQSMGV